MPSSDPARRLAHIVENIDRVKSHVEGMDIDAFLKDIKAIDAVERCFQRICEAARIIGPEIDERHPNVDWRTML